MRTYQESARVFKALCDPKRLEMCIRDSRQRILLNACPQPAADRVDAGDGAVSYTHLLQGLSRRRGPGGGPAAGTEKRPARGQPGVPDLSLIHI